MKVGETTADYLLFGALDAEGNDAKATLDWACWWAEMFNVPCIGVAHVWPKGRRRWPKTGAEFVGLGPRCSSIARGKAAAARRDRAALEPAAAET